MVFVTFTYLVLSRVDNEIHADDHRSAFAIPEDVKKGRL